MSYIIMISIFLIIAGLLVLIFIPTRPGGNINIGKFEVSSKGAGLPIIFLGVVLILSSNPGSRPVKKLGDQGKLKFSLTFADNYESGMWPNLSFWIKSPYYKAPENWAKKTSGLYEVENITYPKEGERFKAEFRKSALDSEYRRNPNSDEKVTKLCFIRNPKPPVNLFNIDHVRLNCSEGERCTVAQEDPGLAKSCQKQIHGWNLPFSLISVASAETTSPNVKEEPGWVVPSLETLRGMKDSEKIGYTEFLLETDSLPDLQADYFTYTIRVNGTPIFIDGWAHEVIRVPFDPSKGVSFSFGLENLVFSGGKEGLEVIEIAFEFRRSDRVVKRVRAPLRYAALRDSKMERIETGEGIVFRWSGTYAKPKKENKFEIFLISFKTLRAVERVQEEIGSKKLRFENKEVVGVIRPPLHRNESFGVVIGLRQSTGKIKYTFDEQGAKKLCRWAEEASADEKKLKHIIDPSPYRYEMEPRTPGTPKAQLCRNL